MIRKNTSIPTPVPSSSSNAKIKEKNQTINTFKGKKKSRLSSRIFPILIAIAIIWVLLLNVFLVYGGKDKGGKVYEGTDKGGKVYGGTDKGGKVDASSKTSTIVNNLRKKIIFKNNDNNNNNSIKNWKEKKVHEKKDNEKKEKKKMNEKKEKKEKKKKKEIKKKERKVKTEMKEMPEAEKEERAKRNMRNIEILSQNKAIDMSYEPVSNLGIDHPHMGGIDENGGKGYVHDETKLRLSKEVNVDWEEKCGNNNDGNFKMLTNRVRIDKVGHDKAEEEATFHRTGDRVKIMCVVYTISENHERLPAIRETWARDCDGFMVASDSTDPAFGSVNIPHQGEEAYNNIWQKIRSVWSYVYHNYHDKYDWFHIGGDDLFVMVENLRLYLESDEILAMERNGFDGLPSDGHGSYRVDGEVDGKQHPLFLGRRFKEQGNVNRIFNSGGSGYTINRAALKNLVFHGSDKCNPTVKTFAEDVMVAACFRKFFDVFPIDTKDNEGSERYMPFQVSN